jgi:hypothetical protein
MGIVATTMSMPPAQVCNPQGPTPSECARRRTIQKKKQFMKDWPGQA